MKLPQFLRDGLRIGTFWYTFRHDLTACKAADADGVTIMSEGVILIKPGLATDRERETAFHEIFHACIDQTSAGLSEDKEERVVKATSPLMWSTLRDNPKLVAWLFEDLTQ